MTDREPLTFGFDKSELKVPELIKAAMAALKEVAKLDVASMASPTFWKGAAEGTVKMALELARFDVADVLVGGWKTHQKFAKYADKAKYPPDKESREPLLPHKIVSKHKPYIEIFIDGSPQGKIPFELEVEVVMDAGTVVIKDGYVTALERGKFKVTGKLKCGGTVVVEKATRDFPPKELVSFGEPGLLLAARH